MDLLSSEPKSIIDSISGISASNENKPNKKDKESSIENINPHENGYPDSNDLITVNLFPISLSHCNLVLNYDKNFCQVLSNELISQALEIFSLTNKSNLKVGFNSLAAGCLINHLHFELLWNSEDKSNNSRLAIENSNTKKLFTTNFEHLGLKEEGNDNDAEEPSK